MDTMKAVVYDRPGKSAVRQIPVSEPGAGEVLLRVLVAGVCGTDLHLHHGEFGPTYPLIPGHEIVGEVVAAGPGVIDVRVGEQVTLDNTASCGRCVECRRARPAHCLHLVAQGVNAPGGFAEFVVTDADRCFNVDDLDPEVAVLAEPTACVVHGMDVLALPPGSNVLLFGAGPTGLLLTQLIAHSGAAQLTVAAPTRAKLELSAGRRSGRDRAAGPSRYRRLNGQIAFAPPRRLRRGHRRHRCDVGAPAHVGPDPDRWHRLRVRDDCGIGQLAGGPV